MAKINKLFLFIIIFIFVFITAYNLYKFHYYMELHEVKTNLNYYYEDLEVYVNELNISVEDKEILMDEIGKVKEYSLLQQSLLVGKEKNEYIIE